jgi:ArsR family transcriptional regulator
MADKPVVDNPMFDNPMFDKPVADTADPTTCCRPILDEVLSEDQAIELAGLFKVLSDPVRLRLVNLIAADPDREVCACELVGVLGRSQPTISHHLKQLHGAGLVDKERRGTWIHYRLRPEAFESLRGALASAGAPG